jgi:hypothetical protein
MMTFSRRHPAEVHDSRAYTNASTLPTTLSQPVESGEVVGSETTNEFRVLGIRATQSQRNALSGTCPESHLAENPGSMLSVAYLIQDLP